MKDQDKQLLRAWLLHTMRNGRDVVMPCKDKHPLFKHTEGRWTWDDVLMHEESFDANKGIGILLYDLCVVDVDDEETCIALEKRFPILTKVLSEDTRRGRHYFFLRSIKANREGFYCCRSAKIPKVDFITRHSNGTRGFLEVAPSPNKTWRKTPWSRSHVFVPIPDDLLDAVAVPRLSMQNMEFRLACGTNVWIKNNEFWEGCGMLEPVVSGDLDYMPLPEHVTQDSLLALQAFLEDNTSLPENMETLMEIYGLASMLGMCDARVVRALDVRRPSCMFFALAHHKHFQGHGTTSIVQDVLALQGSVKVTPVPHVSEDDSRWLFHSKSRSFELLSSHDAIRLHIERIPDFVLETLLVHSGNMILAGGAALHAMCPYASPGNDYDLYVLGSPGLICKIVFGLMQDERTSLVAVSHMAITFMVKEDDTTPSYTMQIILRGYESTEEVLCSFDIEPCKVGLYFCDDVLKAVATDSWVTTVRHAAFSVDPHRWDKSTATRILKYYCKGFDVYLPGLYRECLKPHSELACFLAGVRTTVPNGFHDLMLVEGEVCKNHGTTTTRLDLKVDIQPVLKRWSHRFFVFSTYEEQPCTHLLSSTASLLCLKLYRACKDIWAYIGNMASFIAKNVVQGHVRHHMALSNGELITSLNACKSMEDMMKTGLFDGLYPVEQYAPVDFRHVYVTSTYRHHTSKRCKELH